MKAIFSAMQLGHKPERFLSRGHIVDYPDKPERVRALLDGARGAGIEVHAARGFDDQHIAAVHKWRYLEFLEKAHKRWHRPKGAFNEVMPSARPVERPARVVEKVGQQIEFRSGKLHGAVDLVGSARLVARAAGQRPTVPDSRTASVLRLSPAGPGPLADS